MTMLPETCDSPPAGFADAYVEIVAANGTTIYRLSDEARAHLEHVLGE